MSAGPEKRSSGSDQSSAADEQRDDDIQQFQKIIRDRRCKSTFHYYFQRERGSQFLFLLSVFLICSRETSH